MIPEVRRTIEALIEHWNDTGLDHCIWPDINAEDIDRLEAHLGTQPTMPEPDWSQAATYDDCFSMTPHGDRVVYFPAATVTWYDDGLPCISEAIACGLTYQLDKPTPGIDWRETLRRRPEAE